MSEREQTTKEKRLLASGIWLVNLEITIFIIAIIGGVLYALFD